MFCFVIIYCTYFDAKQCDAILSPPALWSYSSQTLMTYTSMHIARVTIYLQSTHETVYPACDDFENLLQINRSLHLSSLLL